MVNVLVTLFSPGYFLFCHEKKRKPLTISYLFTAQQFYVMKMMHEKAIAFVCRGLQYQGISKEVLHYLRPWTSNSKSCFLDLLGFSLTVGGLQELGLNSMGEHKDGEKFILMLHVIGWSKISGTL